jgi:hypothetical protein
MTEIEKTAFEKTIGRWYDFYGVDNNRFKLGTRVFEAIEDPGDGYRSYLGSVERTDGAGIFFPHPLARVKIAGFDDGTERGYRLTDKTGHVWLVFGTNTDDNYYPCFFFRYQPKPSY